jgi:hypothetical protein
LDYERRKARSLWAHYDDPNNYVGMFERCTRAHEWENGDYSGGKAMITCERLAIKGGWPESAVINACINSGMPRLAHPAETMRPLCERNYAGR